MPYAMRVHEYGGPEKLRWEEVQVGAAGEGDALLEQRDGAVAAADAVVGDAQVLDHQAEAERIVDLDIVESISHETVRQCLKKTS